ncbi:endonuclease/exonuclease/phosphatase family protein [Haloferula chungangensis]|uniref:Endonuclease/exonuclease/phosphatase family protein n=1 Tax=Haloferula chungangensis TaxID=1048331 RepID=A0ABW2L6J6_9BACT
MFQRFFKASLIGLLVLHSASCLSMRDLTTLGASSEALVRKVPVSARTAPPEPTPSTASHFICWNVHKASHQSFNEDVGELLKAVPEKNGLIVCMQEVRSTTFDLIKGLHREAVSGHYAPSWRLPFAKKSTGVMTFGCQSGAASEARLIRAPKRELFVASPKVSLSSDVPLPDGRTLRVVNCHGLNFVPFSVLPNQLDRILESLKDSDSPAIVCGDFNVWSERRLELLNQRASEAGLSEVVPRGPEHSPAPRWLRWMHRINGFDPDIRLDRIYTRGIEVFDCYTHRDTVSSDHLPLVLSYKVLPAP